MAGPNCDGFASPTLGRGINETGQVVGQYTLCGLGNSEAFVWDGGANLTVLQRPPGISCAAAWDINDEGSVAGGMCVDGVGDRAFLHDGTQFIDLGVLPGAIRSSGRGINNQGDVVGKSEGNGLHAFLYRDGVMIDLMPDLGTPAGEAKDINDAGQVVGWMGMSLVEGGEAFVWHDGQITPLGQLPDGYFSVAKAINEVGQVVGSALIGEFPDTETRPFLWDNGVLIDLGILPGYDRSGAVDLNDNVQIVGQAWGVNGNPNIETAFVWQSGTMTDLNDLISPNAGVEMTSASGINNQGQITGRGHADNGDVVAVLLTPVEPPVGDLDGDCEVGTVDLLMLLAHWGPCPDPCPPSCTGDLDGDCAVGVTDFLTLLTNWG